MNQAVGVGFAVGLITILLTYYALSIGSASNILTLVYWSTFVLYAVGMYAVARNAGPEDKVRLRYAFVVYLVANLMYYLFTYVYFGLWYPELQEAMMRKTLASQSTPSSGLNPENLKLSISSVVFAYVQSIIPGFALAWIISRLTKH